ncbi:3-methylmercaptopropionyl-CoA dehydrogenase [BD1-7 clade bacterium]|uniref:3-methylmercaptopropionyl-CoA dehydrogenase n=1 Tax=BD1-7 clade bacterium TaxID=2029982 RepID=A0A5S9Q6D3_9GAMM|nr:3-methylmercaptopropionyl-CoA dehydrogenase [BD1-7 clade bacterium]
MPDYKAPLRDIRFVMEDLLDSDAHYASLSNVNLLDPDTREAIVNEAAKFAENTLAPMNLSADAEGCRFEDGNVYTPTGYKEAFAAYAQGGWAGMTASEELGGQNLPGSIGIVVNEMLGAANWAWNMYTGLSFGAVKCIGLHGTDEQRQTYVTKLIEGTWTGTMCLTEAHCGSDVGLLRTKAQLNDDGSYNITGNKVFITGGDHDMAENIIHLVLARVEGAPEGTKGISLFVVPKFMPDADGNPGERNPVFAGSIEKKMGIKGSATCVMNFDAAKGFIVGEENTGLAQMFTMMNNARLGTAMQGLCGAEGAFQGALTYARERLAMRSLTGPKNPEGPADPIIVHPDVRRMLMTQKALAEGFRAFLYEIAFEVDKVDSHPDEAVVKAADDKLGLLTPIAKAFCTELGFEAANLGIQVFGGHGYIHEHGMEQIVRDVRISSVYEGTTGIQALDLIGRKVMGTGGELLRTYTKEIHKFCQAEGENDAINDMVEKLAAANKGWGDLTVELGTKAMENAEEVGAASVDYLMYGGYLALGYTWLKIAKVASEKLAAGTSEEAFYKAKLATAQFYFDRLLPRTLAHAECARAGAESTMALEEDAFAF